MIRKVVFEDSPSPKPTLRWAMLLSIIGLLATGANVFYAVKIQQTSSSSSVALAESSPTKVTAVTALGRLEPQGQTVRLAPPQNLNGARVIELRVKEGDLVEANQIVAILENRDLLESAVKLAQHDIKVAQANLAIVKAGAKSGEIESQKATIKRLQAQLQGESISYQAKIARLQEKLQGEKATQQATIARLDAELKNAQSEYQRYQQLAEKGAISLSDLDRRHLTLETAKERTREAEATFHQTVATIEQEIQEAKANAQQAKDTVSQQIQEAKANLDRITEVRKVDVDRAESEVQRAKAAWQQAQQELELTYVRAPMNSRVLKIHTYPGESVQPAEAIVELGQTEQMMVTAEIYESDIGQVKSGQTAIIKSENGAFLGELQGTVSEVGWLINRQGIFGSDPASDVDNRVIEVKIRLAEQDRSKVAHLTYSGVIVKILL